MSRVPNLLWIKVRGLHHVLNLVKDRDGGTSSSSIGVMLLSVSLKIFRFIFIVVLGIYMKTFWGFNNSLDKWKLILR